jgi:hypothetical protein
MRNSPQSNRATPTAASTYLVMGFAALVLIGVHILQSPARTWAAVPVLIGACGLVFYWRSAPLGVLVAVAFAKVWPMVRFGDGAFRQSSTLLSDAVLCAATLTYIVAQYRLIAMRVAILPSDARNETIARDPAAVHVREAVSAIFAVVAATVGAFFLWQLTFIVRPPWMIARAPWRLGLLVWIVGIGLIAIASAIGYIGWRRQSRAEAMLVLRDEFWRQTRGEQRRINRWTAWASRRRERAGEPIE